MTYSKAFLAATLLVTFTGTSLAQQCNFDKKVGSCTGIVSILSTSGSGKNHNAEISIQSSTGGCSKVEYYLHNTPQTALVRSSGIEYESVFGTKQLKPNDINVIQCTAYQGDGAASGVAPDQRARYGRCVGDAKMIAELDSQYANINAMIADETLASMKEMQDYFAADNQDNPRWIRRQKILNKCL